MEVLQKEYFNNMPIDNQIEYINNLLQQGNTITKACKLIGIARSTVGGRFNKAGYNYNEVLHKYCNNNTSINIKPKDVVLHKHSNSNTSMEYNSNTKVIQQLEGIMPTLMEMLEWYKLEKKVIDIKPIELDLDQLKNFKGKVKNHSFKCDDDIYKEYIKVLDSYSMCKNQDLNTLALLEFINKYKK